MDNTTRKLNTWLPILFALVLIFGMLIGMKITSKTTNNPGINASSDASDRIEELLGYIEARYVDDVNMDELVDEAISTVLGELDPHSNYIPASKLEDVNSELEGEFEGIGVQFTLLNDTIYVVAVIDEGPSQVAGILAGDRIIQIDDSLMAGQEITNKDVIDKLKGKKGSEVKLLIERNKEQKTITVKRDKIPLYSVEAAYMLPNNTGYVKISRFSATTFTEFMKAIENLSEQGMKDLVLDLRQNPGGYLNAATKILDQIFSDKNLLVYTKGKNYDKNEYKSTGRNFYSIEGVAILIDEGSASASEIVAGAIQDWDRGVLVGRRSFGKGLVQEQYDLSNGGALRLTVARYYTPSNRCIQKSYDDREAYDDEAYNRFDNGELESKDSINITDTTKYYTANGRVVYGSGGITPDVFVPFDDALNDKFLVHNIRYVPDYVYTYLDGKREQFEGQYEDMEKFLNRYTVTDNMVKEYVKYALKRSEKTETPTLSPVVTKEIKNRIKAHVARQFYSDEGYYRVLNKEDEVVNKALKEIVKWK